MSKALAKLHENNSPKDNSSHLYTVSKLAKDSGLKPSTIRFYIKEGLIEPVGRTESNYQLFDRLSLERVFMLKEFRKARFTLDEMKEELGISKEGVEKD
jgi:DNA-binding transcriptional MerR regulator